MASIIDSFREVFSDFGSFFKVLVFAVPVYYSYFFYMHPAQGASRIGFLAYITLFFLFGFLIRITNNVINERNEVLPSLNPIKLAFSAFKGVLGVIPISVICCWIAMRICSVINIVPWFDNTMQTIIWIVVASIILMNFMLFAAEEKITKAYDLKLIFEKAGDLIITILVFLIQNSFINIVTFGFLGYLILVLFGFGPIFDAFISFALVFNIGVLGHYIGQVYYENITYHKNKDE